MTSPIEMISVISTSRTEARMVRVESTTTARWIAGGIEAWSCGSTARMRSTVSMMLAPGWRKMISRIAGLPFARPPLRLVFHRVGDVCRDRDSRTAAPFL